MSGQVRKDCSKNTLDQCHNYELDLKHIKVEMVVDLENLNKEDNLPKNFCWECTHRLITGSKFRHKALKAQMLLTEVLDNSGYISKEDIENLTQNESNLKSSLSKRSSKVNEFDLTITFGNKDSECNFEDNQDHFDENTEDTSVQPPEQAFEIDIKEEFPEYENQNESSNELTNRVIKKEVESDDSQGTMNEYMYPSANKINTTSNKQRLTQGVKKANLRHTFEPEESCSKNNIYISNKRRKKGNLTDKSKLGVKTPIKKIKIKNNRKIDSTKNNFKPLHKNISDGVYTLNDSNKHNVMPEVCLEFSTKEFKATEQVQNVNSELNNMVGTEINCNNAEVDKRYENTSSARAVVPYSSSSSYKRNESSCLNSSKRIREKKFPCPHCDMKYAQKSHLKEHFRSHTGEKPFKCEYCNFTTKRKRNLKDHIISVHTKEKKYSCEYCEYKCTRKSILDVHIRKHTGERPFICDVCDHRTTNLHDLRVHIRHVHLKEKNFSCNQCNYRCKRKNCLNIHVRKHTGEKPYKCDVCDYRCSSNNALLVHKKHVHDKKKKYSCDQCEYKSGTRLHLKVHLRTHTGEKPFACDICDYKCARKDALKVHIQQVHIKEMKYSCDQCKYKCGTSTHLSTHYLIHTGEKPFKCHICSYAGRQNSHLKKHLLKHLM